MKWLETIVLVSVIVLSVFSSCSVRKGVQSLVSDAPQDSSAGKKGVKSAVHLSAVAEFPHCDNSGLSVDSDELLLQNIGPKIRVANVIFYLLQPGPRHTYAAPLTRNDRYAVVRQGPPDSVPLYLQNRILLI